MLNTGDVVTADLAGYGYDVSEEATLLVLDRRNSKLLTALIVPKVASDDSFEYATLISKADLKEGNIEYEGLLELDTIFHLKGTDCRKIGAVTSEKLGEVLRLFTKYASSIYFDSFHRNQKPRNIAASGKVLDQSDLSNMIDASLDMWLTAGRFAEEFEKEFSKSLGAAYCAIVNSGSSANLVALSALTSYKLGEKRLKPGDEVMTVAAGFPTTVTPIIQNRLVPVFADVELGTYNIDIEQLEKGVSERTKAIFIAHTLGNPFDVDKVLEIADKCDLWIIEDNCDALGSKYHNKYTGTFGDVSTFSFYPAHHITMGEGGAVVSNDSELHRIICSFRDWGRDCWCPPGKDNTCKNRFGWKMGTLPLGYDHKYIYSHLGYNLKATDFQAAVGLSQLRKLPKFIEKRRENFNLLYNGFKKEGLDEYFILPQWLSKSDVSWFGFPLTLRDGMRFQRKELINFLEKKGIGTRLLFAGNVTRQPAFTENNVNYRVISNLANTDKICMNTFWIGLWPGISERQVRYVIDSFVSFSRAINARRAGNHHGS
jgi:CDP-6-deoxy-D-xylo-4-hexulose-3-dehydrase